jgi:hypothetical protein
MTQRKCVIRPAKRSSIVGDPDVCISDVCAPSRHAIGRRTRDSDSNARRRDTSISASERRYTRIFRSGAQIPLEIEELHLQIRGRPEESAVQTLAPNRANEPFNEWMQERGTIEDVRGAKLRPRQRLAIT